MAELAIDNALAGVRGAPLPHPVRPGPSVPTAAP